MSINNIEFSKVIKAVASATSISEKLLEKINTEVVSTSEKEIDKISKLKPSNLGNQIWLDDIEEVYGGVRLTFKIGMKYHEVVFTEDPEMFESQNMLMLSTSIEKHIKQDIANSLTAIIGLPNTKGIRVQPSTVKYELSIFAQFPSFFQTNDLQKDIRVGMKIGGFTVYKVQYAYTGAFMCSGVYTYNGIDYEASIQVEAKAVPGINKSKAIPVINEILHYFGVDYEVTKTRKEAGHTAYIPASLFDTLVTNVNKRDEHSYNGMRIRVKRANQYGVNLNVETEKFGDELDIRPSDKLDGINESITRKPYSALRHGWEVKPLNESASLLVAPSHLL